MKSRIATIFMLCLFIATTAFATQPVPASKAVRASVVDLVKKNIDYPAFAVESKTECCVVVSMIIQDNGTLKVDAANSLSPELQKYVIGTIEKLQEKNLAQYSGQKVLIKVRFELLS